MEPNQTSTYQILPEDIKVETKTPPTVKKFATKKVFLVLTLVILIVLGSLYFTSTKFFKGQVTGGGDEFASGEIQVTSLFKQSYLSSSRPANENVVVFVLDGYPTTTPDWATEERTIFNATYEAIFQRVDHPDPEEVIAVPLNGFPFEEGKTQTVFTVNVNSIVDQMTAGEWYLGLQATPMGMDSSYTVRNENATTFEVVTTESAYNRPVNLESVYTPELGLQYRFVLNPVLNNQATYKTLLSDALTNAMLFTTPATGSANTFTLATPTLLDNSTDFPNSTDGLVTVENLTSSGVTGANDVNVRLSFDFGRHLTGTGTNLVNATTNNVSVTFPAADALDTPNDPPAAPPLTCTDRLSAGSISILPAAHNFGDVIKAEKANVNIEVAKGDGQTFTDLKFVIQDDASPITARIGSTALGESVSATGSTFPVATSVTINAEFNPTSASSYTNVISVYDPRVPATCDPIAVINLQGRGVNAPQATSDKPDEGISDVNLQRPLEPEFNPAPVTQNYYASAYNYTPADLPDAPAEGTDTTGGADAEGGTATSTTESDQPMPIAETGPGILLYPALMAASAALARRFRK